MKMLFIHCDYFSYLTTKQTKVAEEVPEDCKTCAVKDVLVIFVTVERSDEKNIDKIVSKGVEETTVMTGRLGVKSIVLFPFVHLSEEISNSNIALRVLVEMRERLEADGYSVHKAPFGWEKVFSLTSKGHPLAESLRTIRV